MHNVLSTLSEPSLRTYVNRRGGQIAARALTFTLIFALAPAVFGASIGSKPFWEGKPALEAKLRDERAVLVSVRIDKAENDKNADSFSISGVGHVRREAQTVFALAKQFDRLKDVSEVFREVKFDSKTNRVFVICEALGYQARMLVKVDPSKEPIREIHFKVIEGHFEGLDGVMAFRELEKSETEVSFRARLEAREIPIPRVLIGFALEVVIQKVAVKMRTYFEDTSLASKPAKEKLN